MKALARCPLVQAVICQQGIAHLLNFPVRCQHTLTIQDGRGLFLGEPVALAGQSPVDGPDAVDPT